MSYEEKYSALAERQTAAYSAFKQIYEVQQPPPQKAVLQANVFVMGSLAVIVAASAAVSGSRTFYEFGGGFFGAVAFVMIELSIILYAYIRTSSEYNETRSDKVQRLINSGLWVSFAIAVSANGHAELKHIVDLPEGINAIIALMVGVSAPVLALISGDALGMQVVLWQQQQAEIDTVYADEYREWLEGLNASWSRQKVNWGAKVKVSKPDPERIPSNVQMDVQLDSLDTGRLVNSGHGYTRNPDGANAVREYIETHPEALSYSARQLGKLVGVSHGTANTVQRELKEQKA